MVFLFLVVGVVVFRVDLGMDLRAPCALSSGFSGMMRCKAFKSGLQKTGLHLIAFALLRQVSAPLRAQPAAHRTAHVIQKMADLLDDVLDCWGEWRLSHAGRMDALRAFLTACGARANKPAAPPPPPEAEGASTAAGLEFVPRGTPNVPHELAGSYALDDGHYAARAAIDDAEKLEDRFIAAFVTLRTRCQIPLPGEDNFAHCHRIASRGPTGQELSPCDADLAANNLLLALGQELEGQRAIYREMLAIADGTNLSAARAVVRLESRLAVVEQQPFVDADALEELATRVTVSQQLKERRESEVQEKTPRRRKKRGGGSGGGGDAPATA